MRLKIFITIAGILFFSVPLIAQYHTDLPDGMLDPDRLRRFKIGVELGHTRIRHGLKSGEASGIAASSWALNVDYLISEKLSLGLHNDIILENFQVLDNENEIIDRHYPIAILPTVSYEIFNHFALRCSVGAELSKERNFFLYRFGPEYSLKFETNWQFSAGFNYDFKVNGYNSWNIGVGISRYF